MLFDAKVWLHNIFLKRVGKNIKITTIEDIEIFKALLNAKTMTGLKNKANDEIIRF